MGLATFGGVLAGAIYDDIKKNLNKSYWGNAYSFFFASLIIISLF